VSDLEFYDYKPPRGRKPKSSFTFTGLILAIIIVVAGVTFLLTQTCNSSVEEDPNAEDVLENAPDVNPDGVNTVDSVFYDADGQPFVMPDELLIEEDDPEAELLELPPEILALMEQAQETETTDNGSTDNSTTETAETPTDDPPGDEPTYSIQVGAFGERGNAIALRDKLGTDGFRAYVVEPAAGEEKPLYRVRVGPFADRDEAATTAAEVQEKYGLSSYISN
jgi:cell division protein FtsN